MVKIERSFPAPESLAVQAKKKNGSYSEADVIERLHKDFHNKCYICEMKGIQDSQVEHLLPHKNGKYPERKFDWENLFWSCGHCNGVKNQDKYDDGIIDCCKIDPDDQIYFRCDDKNVELSSKKTEADDETKRTMQLIWEIFNIKNTQMRTYKSSFRFKLLQEEMNVLYDNLEALRQKPESKVIKIKLKAILRRESAFAAFKRCYVRDHLSEYPDLAKYL